jgi:hypothetical protein
MEDRKDLEGLLHFKKSGDAPRFDRCLALLHALLVTAEGHEDGLPGILSRQVDNKVK